MVFHSYELTSVSRSIADEDSANLGNKKLDILHLSADTVLIADVPVQSSIIIDAVATIHLLTNPASTYRELAYQVFNLSSRELVIMQLCTG